MADENHGLIENCSIVGTIYIVENNRWYNDYHFNIGGAVYSNEGTIRNCYAKVLLAGKYLSSVQGVGIGGFLGMLGESGTVENCYSISVSGSTSQYAFNNGVGCFLSGGGYKEYGTIKNCYYDGDIITEGKYMSKDGPGYYARHTSAMKLQLNYKDWDFDKVWAIDPAANDGYPYLRSQRSVIVKPQDIVLDRKEIYLVEEAEPFQLHASIIPGNASNQNIIWSSSDRYVASVDSKDGTVTPVSEGEATITATTEEGGYTASCKVNVIRADDTTPYVAEVIVSPSQTELKPGEECQFKAEVKGINNPRTNVQWTVSENKSISTTVTSVGLLKVAEDESADQLTVTAVSVADSSKKASVIVTILQEEADPGQPFTYEALSDGTVKINKYKGTDTQIEVPDKIDGKEVSAIGENAFQGFANITSVKLPESIGKIESGAFAGCTKLASVNLPAKITEISETTFYGCSALASVNLPEGVTSVGDYAFYGCTVLNNIYLPASLKTVGDYAFYDCTGLKKISYGGNENQWKQIKIGSENECLQKAEIAYDSKAPVPEDPDVPVGPGGEDYTSEVLPEDIPYVPEQQFTEGFWGVTTEKEYIYTRKAIKPEVHVYYRENLGGGSYVDRMAEEGLDYTLSYKNNVKASRMYEAAGGQSYAVVTGKNLYKGKTGKITFVIHPAPLKNVLSGDVAVVYNGKEQKKLPSLSYNGRKLSYKKQISKTDFTVSWPDTSKDAYVEPGTYEMVLTGRNNFTGELKVNLVITSKDRLISKASAKIPAQSYDAGEEICPAFDVRLKGITLKKNEDYRVIYQNNTQIGTATAVIYGIYPYGGVKRVNFKITGISLKKAQVSYRKQMLYNGSDQVQDNLKVTMPYAPAPLVEGQDYKVIYAKNKNAGKASFTIVGINQYTGQIRKTFKITPRSIDDLQGLDQEIGAGPESLESGKYKPKPRLSFNGKKLIQGRDYTVSYKNNKITASRLKQPMITIKGKGNFKGSRTIEFTIKE